MENFRKLSTLCLEGKTDSLTWRRGRNRESLWGYWNLTETQIIGIRLLEREKISFAKALLCKISYTSWYKVADFY